MGYRFFTLPVAYRLLPFLILLILLSFLTYSRNLIWRDQITLWSDTARKSPKKARPYNDIGNVYFLEGRFADAVRMYQKAVSLKPDFYEVRYNLGLVYFKYGMWTAAINEFKTALATGGEKELRIHNKLGDAYAEKGMFDEALKGYITSLMLDSENHDAYYGIARIYSMRAEKDAAIEHLKRAINAGFKDYDAIKTDRAFDNIRNDGRYKAIIEG